MKRIDNYGPPNAKSPFGQSDEKPDSKSEISTEEKIIKKNESQSADENASHADSSGVFSIQSIILIHYNTCYFAIKTLTILSIQIDPKVMKVEDKKAAPIAKPAFSGPSPTVQRKDSTGQKVESQSISKSEDNTKVAAQPPQPHRGEKTPPFVPSEKSPHRYFQ